MSLVDYFSQLWPDVSINLYQPLLEHIEKFNNHGDVAKWQTAIDALPQVTAHSIDMNADAMRIGEKEQLSTEQRAQMQQQLMHLHPWRKGPFELFGLEMDLEWQPRAMEFIPVLVKRRPVILACLLIA